MSLSEYVFPISKLHFVVVVSTQFCCHSINYCFFLRGGVFVSSTLMCGRPVYREAFFLPSPSAQALPQRCGDSTVWPNGRALVSFCILTSENQGFLLRENVSERISASLHINGSLKDKGCDLFLSAGPDVGLTLHCVLWLPDSHPHSTSFFRVSDTATCTGTQMNLNSGDIMQQFRFFFFPFQEIMCLSRGWRKKK